MADSTLLNNYRATNLINSKDLLVLGSFVKLTSDNFIKYSTSSLLVLGYRKRVIKNILNSAYSERTEDLVLLEVAIIKGFYVNIVSEARLLNIKV